jgi:hypothetical protein
VLGLLAAVRGLERYTLLDRMLRGRVWIGLIAFALIGIVALQLGLLKLNAGIGRSLEREGSLQRGNAALKIENSELAAGERVEAKAAHLGMQLVPVGALKALTVHPGTDVPRAASALTSSSASSYTGEASSTTTSSTGEEPAASTPTTEQPATEAPAGETEEAAASTTAEAPPASEATTPPTEATAPASTETQAPSTSTTPPTTTEAAAGGGTQAGPAG